MNIYQLVKQLNLEVMDAVIRAYQEPGSEVTTADYFAARLAVERWHGRTLKILEYPYMVAEQKRWGSCARVAGK